MQKEFIIKTSAGVLGKILFTPPSLPDRLTDYNEKMVTEYDRTFYKEFYSQETTPLDTTRAIQHESLWKLLEPHISGRFGMSGKCFHCLDIGCGRGNFVNFLQRKIASHGQVYGIEPAIAKETASLKRADIFQLKSGDSIDASWPQRFTFISILDVLEHFPDPKHVIDSIHSLLNDSGILLIKVPNKLASSYRLSKVLCSLFPAVGTKFLLQHFQLRVPPPHFFYFSKESLEGMLVEKFNIVETEFLSEVPLAGLSSRFWYASKLFRPFLMALALLYKLLSTGSRNDSIVLLAQKK